MNGSKEKINLEFNNIQNTNKDEIIKSLCLKVNALEEKCKMLEKNYEKIMDLYEKEKKFKFQWEKHENCQLSNKNKILRKIKNNGWNTYIKGNKILRKDSINIFKIKVNEINNDNSGLCLGISNASSSFSHVDNWNMCFSFHWNKIFNSFKTPGISKGDIITFIVDLKDGNLEIKKNDEVLGKLNNIPINEDLVPTVCNYYINNEIEIID